MKCILTRRCTWFDNSPDKQVVIFECFAVFVCVAGIDVALENTVHDRLDKGVDAGYCVHGLQLLFFELFTGFYPGEQESATLYLWVGIFFRTVVSLGEGVFRGFSGFCLLRPLPALLFTYT